MSDLMIWEEIGIDGQPRGRDPMTMTESELAQLGHTRRPFPEIVRATCLQCQKGDRAAVRGCRKVVCALWAYREGNPLARAYNLSPDARKAVGVRLASARAEKRAKAEAREQKLRAQEGETRLDLDWSPTRVLIDHSRRQKIALAVGMEVADLPRLYSEAAAERFLASKGLGPDCQPVAPEALV